MRPAYVHNWELQRDKGPQSVADRHNVERLNYLGHPRRFIYYSGIFFAPELQTVRMGATIEDVTEGEFMEALKRTSARAANHAVVRNYLVAHSGPQCFIKRFDQALMALEPRAPHTAAVRPKAFEWIECSRCKKTATGRCGNGASICKPHLAVRNGCARATSVALRLPRLSGLLTDWFLHGVPTDRVVKLRHVEKVLKSNGLSSVWEDGGYRIALLDCVSDLAVQHVCRCEEGQEMIAELWNKRDGQAFDCVMLCDCSCEEPCDWNQARRLFGLQQYFPGCNVTVHWSCDQSQNSDLAADVMQYELGATVHSVRSLQQVDFPHHGEQGGSGHEVCNTIDCSEQCDRALGRTVKHRLAGKRKTQLVLAGLCQKCYKRFTQKNLTKAKALLVMKDPSLVDALLCNEHITLRVAKADLPDVSELHFYRQTGDPAWRINPRARRLQDQERSSTSRLDYRSRIASGYLPTVCFVVPDISSPIRTAKIHAALRKPPLEAILQVQDIMVRLVLFQCRECRIRFPAFHPDFEPPAHLQLQIQRQCPTAVAEWDERPSQEPNALATRHTGLCRTCADDLGRKATDELLHGVSLFGARNTQDPLAGFPSMDVDSLTQLEYQHLFRQATVLEAMLVALNHMQVSVCEFTGRQDRRTGITRFRKNIISFPQHVSELQQHLSFVAGVMEHDIVNVFWDSAAAGMTVEHPRLRRARVLEKRPDAFVVRFTADEPAVTVRPHSLRSRFKLPWRPSDLRHSFIVLRRRRGLTDQYVEDLRVRRNFVVALLQCLSRPGLWRAHRGVEPMHMYYTEFDWLPRAELEMLLPEDGVPSSLAVHDLDEEDARESLTSHTFQQWLWEGRHDCEVALAFHRLFATQPGGVSNASLANFFVQLWEDCSQTLDDEDATAACAVPMVPVAVLATRLQDLGHVPFDTSGACREDVHAQLVQQIWEEVHSVEAYVSTWSGSTCVPQPERHLLSDTIFDVCSQVVQPWPTIERDPTLPHEEGRFAKAFPLEFPMGTGDLRQPRLRDDFTAADWAQHKFRYYDGRFVDSKRGHRVTWAIFNTVLLEATKQRGRTYYRFYGFACAYQTGTPCPVGFPGRPGARDVLFRCRDPDDAYVLETANDATGKDCTSDVLATAVVGSRRRRHRSYRPPAAPHRPQCTRTSLA